ncbi:MAG TPA: hypothetical protein VJ744_08290 [Gaiellaceae bacterium]|nr:hypothetical protein [Gaiellaceae bacterium]
MGDDLLFPLVDEPIGAIVDRIQSEEAAVAALAASPRRQLAFRTFAYVRVGILLGRLLVERDLEPVAGEEGTWVDQLLADPEVIQAVRAEVRAVAEEVASDPSLAGAEPVGPDDATRERFRAFARRLGR